MAEKQTKTKEPIIVKKYPNRRLYDTGQSTYVTLEDLRDMVKEDVDFVVQDAKTGEDLTRSVLAQVVVEQEAKGDTILPAGFWRKIIAFYGAPSQSVISSYLENTLDLFITNQEKLQSQINQSFDGLKTVESLIQKNPVLEEINKQNRDMIERTLDVLDPFGALPRASSNDEKED